MYKHLSSFTSIFWILIFTLSISQLKATPAENDSTSANALSFLQAPPESTHFEYNENPAMAISSSLGIGNNVWTNELYTIDPADPGSPAVLTGTSVVSASGDFAPDDPDHLWIIDMNDNFLKRLNVNTGLTDQEVLINHSFTDGSWTVLSINKITGEFYGVATDGSASEVYLIDPVSGATTPKIFLEIPAIVSGTFDGGNQLFLFDILNDEIWNLDVQTEVLSMLGSAGFDGNYAQGMGFDPFSGDIYLAAYNNVEGAELRVLDQVTGNTTLIGALPGETTGFGFTQIEQQDLFLQAGLDHYTVPLGSLSLGDDLPEIPQGFFGPGSEPFFGTINLQGANSQGSMQAQQDVIINRKQDMPTPEPFPATATVPIEIVSLNLRSVEPITVQVGTQETNWHVGIQLFDGAPSQGGMNIMREDLNGGDFNMDLLVQPLLVFSNVDDPTDVRIFHPIEFGFEGLQLQQPDPFGWMAPPIPNEFDPFGEEGLKLVTPSGNQIILVPFLIREDFLFLSMDEEGQPESWEGTGYNNSEWYYYPFTDWWNVWFYDHPLDVTRHKLVSGNLQVLPRNPDLPSYVEIIVNWSTPEWPQWNGFPEVPLPPLPDLMIDPEYENQVIERSEPIFIWEQTITEPIDVPIPSDYLNNFTGLFNFNPEWVSIDLRGFNFAVSGELHHICFKPWSECEVICPDDIEVCATDEPFGITGASPAGGFFSGNGVNAIGIFDPGNASWGNNVITYTYTCPDGTEVSCDFNVYVIPPPEMVCPPNLMVCYGDVVALSGGLPGGGIYTGPGVSGNTFSSIASGIGSFEITYSVTEPCPGECVFYITVNPNPEVSCPDDFTLCADDDPIDLMTLVSPTGGSFTGGQIFDPSTAPPGVPLQIKYTYTDPDTGCEGSCVFYITVWPEPELQCPEDFTLCADDDPVDLMTLVSPQGGTFSGGQIFDPSQAPPGVPLQTWYTYVDPDTGCEATCIFYITVWPTPEVECPDDFAMCADDDPIDLMTLVSPAGGSFSGGQIFDPSTAPPGVPLQIKYTYVDPDTGCEASCIFYITVWPTPDVECQDDMEMCIDDGAVSLSASPAGGSFSGAGISGDSFDPATAGVGMHTIEYCYTDPDTGCAGCCEFTITVHDLPVVNCPDDKQVCLDDAPFALMGATPAGGTYSGTGVAGGMFNPSAAGVGVHFIYYDYTDPNTGCEDWCFFLIEVLPLPDVDCPDDFAVCEDDAPFALGGGIPAGGTYAGAGVAGGNFNPAAAGDGVHTIKYTYTDPTTGCSNSCTFKITVHELPDVDCPNDFSVCVNDLPFPLAGGNPVGGTYAGPGVFAGNFNPLIAGVGKHDITYTYTDPITGCDNSCTFEIEVHDLPDVDCPDDVTVCSTDPAFSLVGAASPPGGIYAGAGVAGGMFDPSAAGIGANVITYTYTDPDTGCSNSCTFTIYVVQGPNVVCPPNFTVCESDPSFALTGAMPAGGTYSGTGVASGNFYPGTAGAGLPIPITYTYTDPTTGCTGTCVFNITVVASPVVTCPSGFSVCINDGLIPLPDGNPTGGWHVGPGVAGGVFNPAAAGVGVKTIIYRWTDPATGCTGSCTFTITVHDLPDVTCSNLTVCIDDGIINLGQGMPAGGTYAGPGVVGGTSFNPQTAGAGMHNITYTYVDPNTGCENECEFTISVIDPDVDCPPDTAVCENDSTFILTGATPAGGVYSGIGVSLVGGNYEFDPSVWGAGTVTIQYVYTVPGTNCSDTCDFDIIIHENPQVDCPPNDTICESDPEFALGGATPVGGVYEDSTGTPIGIFKPSWGPGTYPITYIYTDQNGCADSCTFSIVVRPDPVVTCPPDMVVNLTDPAFALAGATPVGGVYTDAAGNVIAVFNPAGAGLGVHPITYAYTDPYGCADSCTFNITVISQQDELDFGDAPDGLAGLSYNTLLANAGARHIIDPDVYLGDRIDGETDGQPTMAADGDDLAGMDDEDGVTLPASVVPGSTVTISVKASVDGFLDGWMDFNLNGTWMEPGEHIFASQFVVAGMNSLSFTVPAGASYGQSYLRFRFRTSTAPIDYKGLVQNGEVEDYTLYISDEQPDNLDFGDAPDNGGSHDYHTLMANNGARHVINPDVFLGDLIDAEINGQPNLPALGDDYNNLDDEDGLRMKRFMAVGDVAKVSVKASVDGFLNAWIDFNRDGKWSGPGEQIFTDEPLTAGWNTFTFMVPTTAEQGRTYARFRYNTTGGLTYEGPAADGEVEDYLVAIYPENWGFEVTDLSHLIVVPVDVNQVLKGSDSYSLMEGDFLGVFFDDDGDPKCGGAISWQGNDNQVLIAYGDDPTTPEKEGFDEGEMMNFKVSVAATGEEFDAQVAFDPDQPNSNGQFQNNGLSALTGIELVGLTQTLQIAEGWSGISTYLEPLNTNVEDMFAPVANDLVVLYKLNGSMYWPAQNVNTMGQWNTYHGYVVKMEQDATLEVNGTELLDKSVQLQEGTNLIPVLSEFPYDVELLFSTVDVVQVKEVAGTGVYLPDWGVNTIGAVVPGGAYFAMTNQAGIISFDPGSNKAGAVYEPASVVSSPWNAVDNTPGSHVVVFNLSDNTLQQGDVIGGFTADGHCAGVVAADGETFALTLNAADPFDDNLSGFEAGELIALKLYREATGETFELEATYSENYNQQHFTTNGLSEVTGLKATATGTHDGLAAEINVYPNPSSGIFNLSHAEDVEVIEVMDSFGKLIISEKPGFDMRVDLSAYPSGIYFLKAIAIDGSESLHKLMVR